MRLSPPATDTQRGLRSERGTPRSAPMHYLRTHAGQGMADRQGRGQTGGRGNPRLGLLRQDSRRGRVKLEILVYQRRSVKRQCHDVYLAYIVSEREVPLRNA